MFHKALTGSGQAELDRRIGEDRWPAGTTVVRREPRYVIVEPDQHLTALAQRGIVGGPVRGAVAGWRRLRHDALLTSWIPAVNPHRLRFCNNAEVSMQRSPRVLRGLCRKRWLRELALVTVSFKPKRSAQGFIGTAPMRYLVTAGHLACYNEQSATGLSLLRNFGNDRRCQRACQPDHSPLSC